MKRISLFLAAIAAAGSMEIGNRASAEEVGGFEMTTYYVGFLYRGAKWTPEVTPESTRLQEAHMANIRRMGAEGKLLVAGPFADDGPLRGMYVFKVATKEEAEILVRSDPAVQAGRLRFELHPWFAAKNIVVTAHASPPAGH
ncbi:MAG: YciI family protein [Acidobacteriota bacterium]|nr:YciI family protein [Acidobacteriota bacterium]